MNMQEHILTALREQFDEWQNLLSELSAEQIATPLTPSDWTPKDVVAHLMAWQQRSIARLEAAQAGREPVFPVWLPGIDPEDEGSTNEINAYLYETYRDRSWPQVYQDWQDGYRRFLDLGGQFSEPEFLDGSRYPWLEGYALAYVMVASYDHHQEHREKLQDWLENHRA